MRGLSKDPPLPPSTPQLRIHRYKQKHAADESASSKWAVTRAASESARAVTRTGRGCLGVRTRQCEGPLGENETPRLVTTHTLSPPTHTLSSTASGLSLRDANCFCYLCQVPTLPRHILQTGPGPSAAFCVCSRNEKEKKNKTKCAAICSERTTVSPPGCGCRIATMRQIHTLSQRMGGKNVCVP